MVLIQSQFQNIFNRLYVGSISYLWMIIPLIVVPLFVKEYSNSIDIGTYLLSGIVILAVITLWLVVFNSGKSKVIEYGVELNDEGVSFIKYGSTQTILWTDFAGFTIKNKLPRSIILKNTNSQNIEFSYYTFSSEQRRELFRVLSTKQY